MIQLERLFDKGVRWKKAPKPRAALPPPVTELIVFPSHRLAMDKQREFEAKGHLYIRCVGPEVNNIRGMRMDRITIIRGDMPRYRPQQFMDLIDYAVHCALRPNGVLID